VAQIRVATDDIKKELVDFAALLNSFGVLPPLLASFNYESLIQPLANKDAITVFDSVTLEVRSDYRLGESDYFATVYDPSNGHIFTGDIFYNQVHLYLGPNVDADKLENWVGSSIDRVKDRYGDATLVVPGHGEPFSEYNDVVDAMRAYADTFGELLLTCDENESRLTLAEVGQGLISAYPSFAVQAFPSDSLPTNPAWNETRADHPCNGAAPLSAFLLGTITLSLISLFF
jgi:hypothetical protein